MGLIIIDGISVDTEDIDLLVRHKPLAELDALVAMGDSDDPYLHHRYQTHLLARDIAEYCVLNGIPSVDLPLKERDRTQGLFALQKARELEGRIARLEKLDATSKGTTNKQGVDLG